jgi:hypothetical protein
MTTFKTIQEAFKNGQGDVFFSKNGQYVCFSRNDGMYETMQNNGFKLLTYDEVIKLSFSDNSVASAKIWASAKKKELKLVASRDNLINGFDGYYDEFPDAYGQNL